MNLSELYNQIADEFGVSPLVVENIIRHQFSFIKKNLQQEELRGSSCANARHKEKGPLGVGIARSSQRTKD